MKRFKSGGHAQRFLSVHDQVANLFRLSAASNAAERCEDGSQAFTAWAEVTGVAESF
jgi:putative transposase